MRLAFVSDIHGNLPALDAVVDDLRGQGADLVVDCGDLLSGPLWPAETAARLLALGWPTIRGNHERWLLACAHRPGDAADRHAYERTDPTQRAWLASLPALLRPAAGVLVCHGTPARDTQYLLETVTPAGSRLATVGEIAARLTHPAAAMSGAGGSPDAVGPPGVGGPPTDVPDVGVSAAGMADAPGAQASPSDAAGPAGCAPGALAPAAALDAELVVCGHSHLPRACALPDGRLIVNPGSVGLPAYDDDAVHVHIHEAGSPHARYALCERTAAGAWSVAHRCVAYDWAAASRRAARQGAHDWARWLATGRA